MLNLVASGMLLRPIIIRPPASPMSNSTLHKAGSEKDPLKNHLNGISNGTSKMDSSPLVHRDTLIIENPVHEQNSLPHLELKKSIQNGVNGTDGSQMKTSPEMNGFLLWIRYLRTAEQKIFLNPPKKCWTSHCWRTLSFASTLGHWSSVSWHILSLTSICLQGPGTWASTQWMLLHHLCGWWVILPLINLCNPSLVCPPSSILSITCFLQN